MHCISLQNRESDTASNTTDEILDLPNQSVSYTKEYVKNLPSQSSKERKRISSNSSGYSGSGVEIPTTSKSGKPRHGSSRDVTSVFTSKQLLEIIKTSIGTKEDLIFFGVELEFSHNDMVRFIDESNHSIRVASAAFITEWSQRHIGSDSDKLDDLVRAFQSIEKQQVAKDLINKYSDLINSLEQPGSI